MDIGKNIVGRVMLWSEGRNESPVACVRITRAKGRFLVLSCRSENPQKVLEFAVGKAVEDEGGIALVGGFGEREQAGRAMRGAVEALASVRGWRVGKEVWVEDAPKEKSLAERFPEWF